MAYVKFYRGLEANLPADGSAGLTEGAFYLTTDTWRLYNVINENNVMTLRPLGEKINFIQEINSLPSAADHIGEFAYVASGNVFAVSITDGSSAKWVQVNRQAADLSIQSMAAAVAAANDTAEITITGSKGGGSTVDASFNISAGSGIDVTATGTDTVVISKTATPLTLNPDSGDSHAFGVDGGKVTLVAGSNITLSDNTTNNTITITGDAGGVGNVDVSPAASNGNGFVITVNGANGIGDSDDLDPTITLGNNSSTSYHFVNGNLNLPVYTKTEIDNSLTGLNAMVYRGTLGAAASGGSQTSVPTAAQIGDTYKVVSDMAITTSAGQKTAHAGDLVIARGDEGSDGNITAATLVWDIVRGADDVDTTYEFVAINNGIKLHSKGGVDEGQLVIAGDGTYITVADSQDVSDNTVTLSHALITQASPIAETAVTQSQGANATYTAVSDVVVNGAGHVTGLKTKTLTVKDTTLTPDGLSVTAPVTMSNGVATITPAVAFSDTSGVALSDDATFGIKSNGSTIELSVANNTINADIVWGAFGPNS